MQPMCFIILAGSSCILAGREMDSVQHWLLASGQKVSSRGDIGQKYVFVAQFCIIFSASILILEWWPSAAFIVPFLVPYPEFCLTFQGLFPFNVGNPRHLFLVSFHVCFPECFFFCFSQRRKNFVKKGKSAGLVKNDILVWSKSATLVRLKYISNAVRFVKVLEDLPRKYKILTPHVLDGLLDW